MNIWPINAETADGFLAAQLILTVIALFAAAALQRLVAEIVDPKQSGAQAGPLGGVMPTLSTTVSEGTLPRGDDVFLVAAARGADRLASALLAAAFAEGWLVQSGSTPPGSGGKFVALPDVKPRLKTLQPLHAELSRYPHPIDASAAFYSAKRVAVEKLMPRMLPELERLALRRSFANRVFVGLPALLFAFLLMELANARWNFTTNNNDAVGFVMFVGVLACAALMINPDRRTTTLQRYLGWLWESSAALRADVAAQRRTAPDEVALTAVLEGTAGSAATLVNEHPFAPARAKWPITYAPSAPIDLPTQHDAAA